ncbi:mitotic-spindle organizing protein 2B-like [Alligator mississippiensis]|uniref:Mitotic-spindle organizing protein 2B-like n=1 Tax=Alligator mississippiensis TaxID=8496 RepID=A0A151MAB3_ALLMI|nr:mitotic-spindle organizing protein 2B-like [Alligator mississippiensis]
MSAPGPAGPGAGPAGGAGLDAALGKAAASVSVRSRRKLLTAEEAELFELAQAAGSGLDPEVFKILLDLLRMNVAPLAVFQMLKSIPADACSPLSQGPPGSFQFSCCLFSPFAGRNKTSSAVSGVQTLAERSSREGSAQRMPRQPSTSRLQKTGTSGKSSGGSST